MAQLPGMDVKLIRLNPEWSVENATSTPLEQNLSIKDFNGKRLIITLPGALVFAIRSSIKSKKIWINLQLLVLRK